MLDYINDRTLTLAYIITQACVLFIFAIIYPVYKKKYLMTLLIGFALTSIGLIFILFRASIPDFMSVIMGNLLVYIGFCILTIGFNEIIGKETNRKLLIGLVITFSSIHVFLTYGYPNVGARIISYSFFILVAYFMVIIPYINYSRRKFSGSVIGIIFSYILLSLSSLQRMINALQLENVSSLFRGAAVFKTFLLVSILVSIIQIICILTLNTKDLIRQ